MHSCHLLWQSVRIGRLQPLIEGTLRIVSSPLDEPADGVTLGASSACVVRVPCRAEEQGWLRCIRTLHEDLDGAHALQKEQEFRCARVEGVEQAAHGIAAVGLLPQLGGCRCFRCPQWEAEERPRKRRAHIAAKVAVRLKLIGELLEVARACKADLEAWVLRSGAWQRLGVRIEEDDVLIGDERGHVREVVHGVEAEPEPASRRAAGQLGIGAYRADVAKVLGGELGVVVAVQGRALPRLHGRAEKRRGAMRALVQHEGHAGGARIIGILYDLVQDAHAIRVQPEDVMQPAGERLVLPKCLDIFEAERECV